MLCMCRAVYRLCLERYTDYAASKPTTALLITKDRLSLHSAPSACVMHCSFAGDLPEDGHANAETCRRPTIQCAVVGLHAV
jgi:hypothetical protein